MLLFYDKRRYKPNDIRTRVNQHQSFVHSPCDNISHLPVKHKTLQKSRAASRLHAGKFFHDPVKALFQISAHLINIRKHALLVKQVDYLADCRAGKRISAVGRAVVSRRQRGAAHLLSHDKCAHRHTTAKGLGRGHYIRPDPIPLPGKHMPRPAHTALNLVQYHQNVPLVAKGSDLFHKVFRRRIDTALTLHGLKQNRTGLIRHLRHHTVKVIQIGKPDIADHGLKGFPVMGISRNRKSSHGTPVERMVHGDDLMIRTPVL